MTRETAITLAVLAALFGGGFITKAFSNINAAIVRMETEHG